MNNLAETLRSHIQTLRLSSRNDGMVEDMEKAANALESKDVEYADPLLNNSSASVMLINAMASVAPEDLQPLFNPEYTNGKCYVKVELKVNGVPVPFMEEVERGWKILESSMDEFIQKKALELISRAKLDHVLNALENAEWQIQDALSKALKD